jgi:hypothetical protein
MDNQRSVYAMLIMQSKQLLELTTKYEANTCLALPNACRLSVRTLFLLESEHPWLRTNEKISGVDCKCVDYPLHCMYRTRAVNYPE